MAKPRLPGIGPQKKRIVSIRSWEVSAAARDIDEMENILKSNGKRLPVIVAAMRFLAIAPILSQAAAAPLAAQTISPSMQAVLDYVQSQKTTGFVIWRDGKPLIMCNWAVPADAEPFRRLWTYETTSDGELLEDIASQQKSFVSFLVAVAVDKGLLDVEKPVSAYLGEGWSKATPEQEAKIRILDVLHMSSGLTDQFTYTAPPDTKFRYSTPVYSVTKKVLAAAAHRSLEDITHDWLTVPGGLHHTNWRQRPAAMGDIGNPTGLVTTPSDSIRFGQIILNHGRTADGRRLVSEAAFDSMFERSAMNPAYARLWWLNGSAYSVVSPARRIEGPLIPAAPPDLIEAWGKLDRKIYIIPSLKLVVVRMGQETPDKDFDQQLWLRLAPALGRER